MTVREVAVVAAYPSKWGRAALLEDQEGRRYPVPAGILPNDFQIGDLYEVSLDEKGKVKGLHFADENTTSN